MSRCVVPCITVRVDSQYRVDITSHEVSIQAFAVFVCPFIYVYTRTLEAYGPLVLAPVKGHLLWKMFIYIFTQCSEYHHLVRNAKTKIAIFIKRKVVLFLPTVPTRWNVGLQINFFSSHTSNIWQSQNLLTQHDSV